MTEAIILALLLVGGALVGTVAVQQRERAQEPLVGQGAAHPLPDVTYRPPGERALNLHEWQTETPHFCRPPASVVQEHFERYPLD